MYLGGDRVLIRNVSLYVASKSYQGITAVSQAYYKIVLINCLVCTPWIYIFVKRKIESPSGLSLLLIIFIFLLFMSLVKVSTSVSKGMGRVVESESLLMIARPLAVIVTTLIISSYSSVSLIMLLIVVSMSYVVVNIVSHLNNVQNCQNYRIVGDEGKVPLLSSYKESIPFLLVGIGFPLLLNLDVLILARHETPGVVAVYFVCSKLVGVVLMGLTSANLIIAPKIAPMYRESRLGELNRMIQKNNLFILAITILPVVLLIGFGEKVLSVYGEEYISGYTVLMILLVSQLVNVVSGPINLISTMVGLQKKAAYIVLFACFIEICLAVILIPQQGVLGAAISNVVAMFIANFGIAVLLYYNIGINVTLFGSFSMLRSK